MFTYFEQLVSPFKRLTLPITQDLYRFIWGHTEGIRVYIALIALLSTVIAATEVYIFKFLGDLVDTMSGRSPSEYFREDMSDLLWMGSILLVLLPLSVFLRTLFEHQSIEVNFPVRSLYNLHSAVTKKGIDFFQNMSSGKVANTLLQTSFSARLVIIKVVNTFTFISVFFLSMSVLLTGIDALLLIPALIWVGGYVFMALYYFPKMKLYQENQAYEASDMVGNLVDTYSNIMTVKIFSRHDLELKHAASFISRYLHAAKKNMRIFSMVQFVMWGMNILLIFATFSLSIWLWGIGEISVGSIAASVSVAFRLYTMSHWIMWELLDVSRNIGVVQHGTKLLSSPNDLDLNKSQGENADFVASGVDFKSVGFSYCKGTDVLSDFTLSIKPGEKVGIVGPSGSGKSTIVKLLLRLCDVNTGKIYMGSQNILNLNHEQLLGHVSVVTQDVQILHRSIRENLVYGNDGVAEERMIEVAKAVDAHEFISTFVDTDGACGYDARAGVSGSMLSGGQKQRISIVRALLKEADIYIFDEATSALDVVAENLVMEAIRTLLRDKTVIIITHKESLLEWVDKTVRLDQGRPNILGMPKVTTKGVDKASNE